MSAVNFVLIFRANTTLRALCIHFPHAANTTRTQRDEDTGTYNKHCEGKCIIFDYRQSRNCTLQHTQIKIYPKPLQATRNAS